MRGTTILPGVIAVLVVAALAWLWVRDQRRHGTTISPKHRYDILAIKDACEQYALDHASAWPPDLAALLGKVPGRRPYLLGKCIPLDPWGRPYRYEAPHDPHERPLVWTYGQDGLPGESDDDADVGGWMFR